MSDYLSLDVAWLQFGDFMDFHRSGSVRGVNSC
jgi:hypothetical protein